MAKAAASISGKKTRKPGKSPSPKAAAKPEKSGQNFELRSLQALFEQDRSRIQTLGRSAGSALQVYDVLRRRIVVSIPGVAREADVTWPTAKAALERLRALGIVAESTGRRRDRLYTYTRQLEILNRGTDR